MGTIDKCDMEKRSTLDSAEKTIECRENNRYPRR